MGHAGFEIFIYIYNEKTSFHDDLLKRCIPMFFQDRAVSFNELRGFRCPDGSKGVMAAWGVGGG